MPSDYASTARALSLPLDDDPLEAPYESDSPRWMRAHRRGFSQGNIQEGRDTRDYRTRLQESLDEWQQRGMTVYNRLTPVQRIGLAAAWLFFTIVGILFLVYNHKIFQWLGPIAKNWRGTPGGWILLWLATFVVSFPPLIGYSTCVTLAGFVYGMNGWFVAATATVIGSTASFVVSRSILAGYVSRLVSQDRRFEALALTLKYDGLRILCMIRLCPLPYSLSNGAIATFPTVTWYNFAIATAAATPKLLIHVFIGSRIAAIAEDSKMDTKTRLVNIFSIIFGLVIGIVTGVVIYRRTRRRAEELEAQEALANVEAGAAGPSNRSRPHTRDSARGAGQQGNAASSADAARTDQISLHSNSRGHGDDSPSDEYRDYFDNSSEEDRDVFKVADDDDDEDDRRVGARQSNAKR